MIMIKGLKMMKMAPRIEEAGKRKRKRRRRERKRKRERKKEGERKSVGEKEQPWELDHRFRHMEGRDPIYFI